VDDYINIGHMIASRFKVVLDSKLSLMYHSNQPGNKKVKLNSFYINFNKFMYALLIFIYF